jgi:hypothetical protein
MDNLLLTTFGQAIFIYFKLQKTLVSAKIEFANREKFGWNKNVRCFGDAPISCGGKYI